jgi:hypothetical protein
MTRLPLTALISPTNSRFYTLLAALGVEIQTRVYNGLRCGRGEMLSFRLSSSSYNNLTRAGIAGRVRRESAIADLLNPLGFRFGSISNTAVSHSLRKNEMPLPHSVFQPDPS